MFVGKCYSLSCIKDCVFFMPDNLILFRVFNQVFNENLVIVMLKSAAGGWAGGHQLLVSAQ